MRRILAFSAVFMFALTCFAAIYPQTHHLQNLHTAKKIVKKEEAVIKDTASKGDTSTEDTVYVSFGKNLVNLRTFDGWILDNNNKWVSSPNRIPYRNPDYNNKLYYRYNLGYENIKQINVIEMKIDDVPYLAILFEQYKENYNNHVDSIFKYYVGADYYLIKYEDYKKLWEDKMKMGKPYEVNIKAEYSGMVGYSDIKKRSGYMASEINIDFKNRIYTDTTVKTYLQFGFIPEKTSKGSFMRFNYGLEYAHEGEPITPFDFKVFKRMYYQTSLPLFHEFARPQSLITIWAKMKREKARTQHPKPKRPIAKHKKSARQPDDF